MNNISTTHKHTTKHNYSNAHINNKLPRQKKLNNNSQTNNQPVMPRKTTKATPKSPKKYASKNLSKLKNSQKSTVKVDNKSNKKYGHPPRTQKYSTKKHANNNKKARRFSLISDDSSDVSFSNDEEEEEIDELNSDQGSINVEIEDYESSEDDDDDDDDDDEEDSSSSDSDVDFVKLTAQRKKALKAAKGLATKRTGHKTTGQSKRKASIHEPKVQANNHSDVYNNTNHSEDDGSDINFSFEFELSDNENVAAKLEKEDVGEEVKNVAAGSDKRKNSTKKKLQRRLTNLDKANLLPVPKINEDSDLPLSSVDTSDNENAILTDSSSDDDDEEEEGGDNAKSTSNDDDDDQEIDNDKLAAAIAADENDHPDAYDDETLAEKKKKKLRGLKSRGNSIIGVSSSKSLTGYSDNDNEHAVLSDDDDFLDRETAILLDQIKSENDLYFMNDGFLNNNDLFLGLDNEDLMNVHSNSNNDNSLKKPIVPRMSIVEDPKDVVLREKLKKRVNSRRASKVENNNTKNADEDDDEVIEFVSDDEDKKKDNGINKNDDEEESEIELSVFDDLYYKSSTPFSFSSLNLNNDEDSNNKNDNKYLDAYDQTGDDAYFWDYLLGDGNSNIENGSGNNEPNNSNLVDVSNKLKKIRTKSNRSNSTRKFSNQQKSNLNSRHASINKSQHNAKRASTGHHDSINNMGAMSFDLALGTNEDFMDYQTFFSEEDDELTDEEENLPISSAKNIGSRTVKEVLSSAKVNGGGAPRMATWIAAKDRPFEIIDGLTTRSVLPYTKNSNSSYTVSSGSVGIDGKSGSSSGNNAIHKRNVSIGSDLKFDEFFNLSELEENIDDSINWTALTSNNSLNKRKVPLTAFRNKSSSSNNSNIAGTSATEFNRRYSNAAAAAVASRTSFLSNNLNGNNGGSNGGVVNNSSNAGNHDNIRSRSNSKTRSFRAHSVSNSNKIRRNLKQNLLKQQPKDSKFIINNKPAVTSANNAATTTKKRRQSSVMEANQEGLVFTENGLFSENVLLGVEEFLAETGDIDNDELSGLLSGIQF